MRQTKRRFGRLRAGFFFSLLCLVASLLAPHAASAQGKRIEGCTATQIQSAMADACLRKGEQDVIKGYTNVHVLRCTSSRMECCIKIGSGGWGSCELASVAPRDSKGIANRSPPPANVVCSTLHSEKGEWKPDPRSIKVNSDNKTCSQNFTCNAPEPGRMSKDQRKCNAVVTVSNKQVTQSGICVPGSKPGSCSSCLARPPNEPCTISFSN